MSLSVPPGERNNFLSLRLIAAAAAEDQLDFSDGNIFWRTSPACIWAPARGVSRVRECGERADERKLKIECLEESRSRSQWAHWIAPRARFPGRLPAGSLTMFLRRRLLLLRGRNFTRARHPTRLKLMAGQSLISRRPPLAAAQYYLLIIEIIGFARLSMGVRASSSCDVRHSCDETRGGSAHTERVSDCDIQE